MKGNQIISNRVGIHINELEKVHRAVARAILPVYRTTSTAVLYRESGLGPAELTLDSLSRRAALRTYRLGSRHPLYQKRHKLALGPAKTRLARALETIPPSEEIDPLSNPPWENYNIRENILMTGLDFSGPPNMRASTFNEFLNKLPRSYKLIYSDGSKNSNGNLGAGFIIVKMNTKLCVGAHPVGRHNEIQDAEAQAALHCTEFELLYHFQQAALPIIYGLSLTT
ncbi:hypothetical protein EV44_g3932 [Erysiphe necator]|uniref:RNase H type-1 domain-containing protein n=1 Tax=Uncinula necator TaxID=52586 RepID=A0A0B1P8J7_UNCNE|nr:hypothetical protein EV44_g3932 [Erysiphe necator]